MASVHRSGQTSEHTASWLTAQLSEHVLIKRAASELMLHVKQAGGDAERALMLLCAAAKSPGGLAVSSASLLADGWPRRKGHNAEHEA